MAGGKFSFYVQRAFGAICFVRRTAYMLSLRFSFFTLYLLRNQAIQNESPAKPAATGIRARRFATRFKNNAFSDYNLPGASRLSALPTLRRPTPIVSSW